MNSANLDRIDRAILLAIQADGRMSLQALSERVGLSASPCARRIRKLEDLGVIRGYSALIDESRIGYPVSVFVSVKLDRQVSDALQTFETAVRGYPEVVDCWLMTGNRDYLLRVAVSGLDEFESFLMTQLTKIPVVASIESSFPLRRVKAGISRTA